MPEPDPDKYELGYTIYNVFIPEPASSPSPCMLPSSSGNPLAVVMIDNTDPDFSTAYLQSLAKWFNLSETVFIWENQNNNEGPWRKIRIFTPDMEIPWAGHPTIGAAWHVFKNHWFYPDDPPEGMYSREGSFFCPAGEIDIAFDFNSEVATAEIPHNYHQHMENSCSAHSILHMQPRLRGEEAVLGLALLSSVKGMNFLCVELASVNALERVQTISTIFRPTLDADWDVGFVGVYYWVCMERRVGRAKVRARMIEGLLEDAATGSAACSLAMFIALSWKERRTWKLSVVQGVEMGRRSEIEVVVTLTEGLDGVEKCVLSGRAEKVREGGIEYEVDEDGEHVFKE